MKKGDFYYLLVVVDHMEHMFGGDKGSFFCGKTFNELQSKIAASIDAVEIKRQPFDDNIARSLIRSYENLYTALLERLSYMDAPKKGPGIYSVGRFGFMIGYLVVFNPDIEEHSLWRSIQ
jgi:hypothetical protein